MNLVFIIIIMFLTVVALGVAISAEIKVRNVSTEIKVKQSVDVIGKPETIQVILTEDNAFSVNQYIFIEDVGNFIINDVQKNVYTIFNQQALEDTIIPVNSDVHPSGSTIFTRTTTPSTILAGTFSIFVRDGSLQDNSIIFESTAGIITLPVVSITPVSKLETQIEVLNSDGISVGAILPILSKVTPSAQSGAAGTSGSGLLAKVESGVSVLNFGTGVSVTIPISEGFANLHGPRVSAGLPNSLLYVYILCNIGVIPFNFYFQVTAKNTPPDEMVVTLVDHQINAPYDVPPGVNTLTIFAETGVYFAGDSPAYNPSLASANLFVGNSSGASQERAITGDITITNTGVVTVTDVGNKTTAQVVQSVDDTIAATNLKYSKYYC